MIDYGHGSEGAAREGGGEGGFLDQVHAIKLPISSAANQTCKDPHHSGREKKREGETNSRMADLIA